MKSLPFRTTEEQQTAVAATGAHLRAGGLLVYPTETVYGLGCALQAPALEQLAHVKQRPAEKSFLLLIGERAHAPGLRWTPAARHLADAFWPGPLTLALKLDTGEYPPQVVGPAGTVAVRQTPHAGLQLLLRSIGAPITSTSANLPGQPPALDSASVRRWLTEVDMATRFLLLDGGSLEPSAPSTLVDCSESVPRLVRAGAIPLEELKRCVHDLRT